MRKAKLMKEGAMRKALLLLLALVFMIFMRESTYAQQDVGYISANNSGETVNVEQRLGNDIRGRIVTPRLREEVKNLQDDMQEGDDINSIAQFIDTYFNHF